MNKLTFIQEIINASVRLNKCFSDACIFSRGAVLAYGMEHNLEPEEMMKMIVLIMDEISINMEMRLKQNV